MCGQDYKRCGSINYKEEEFRGNCHLLQFTAKPMVYFAKTGAEHLMPSDGTNSRRYFQQNHHSHNACRSVSVLVLVNEQVVPESLLATL